MTSTAQMALRRIMEKYTANTRFCIIANYTHKLSPALLSRCTRFRFSPLKEADIRSLVDLVIEREAVNIQLDAVEALVRLSKGDMRRALNVLQACHASSTFPYHPNPLLTLSRSSPHLESIANYADRRHPSPHKNQSQASPFLRSHHPLNNLHLYRRSPSRRHPNNPHYPPLDPRHNFLPIHRQLPKNISRPCASGHPHCARRRTH